MLAVFGTHPIFEMGNQTKDDVDIWFRSNVDQEKTEKVVSQYFLLLCYREIEAQKKKRKSTRGRVYNWMGGAKIKGWKALNNQSLTVMQKDGKIWLMDSKGNYSEIVATDVMGSNGVIHEINTVVMPE